MNVCERLFALFLFSFLAIITVSCSVSIGNDYDDDTSADDEVDDDGNSELDYVPLLDEQGRTIILHGANFMAVEYGGQPSDYEKMASWGFNIVRILISWAALEPEPGVYDENYLPNLVEPQVEYAHEAGLKVLLDMHQYHWSSCCGGMGIPDWTCEDIGDFSLEWLIQSGLFWNHPEYLDAFVKAWEYVANFFAGDDRIFAYDLFNEPTAGLRSLPWACENQLYRPLYARLIETIRAIDPGPYLFIEPTAPNIGGFPFVMEPLPYERLVYEPHIYPLDILNPASGYNFSHELLEGFVKKCLREGNNFGAPTFVGELGLTSAANRAEDFTRDVTNLFDKYMLHFTWWAYGFDDNSMGLLTSSGEEKDVFMRYLIRPYPQATAGELREFSFDVDNAVFTAAFDNIAGMSPEVEIFVPTKRHYTDGFAVECSDPDGKWSWKFDEAKNILKVTCDPNSPKHQITIKPK